MPRRRGRRPAGPCQPVEPLRLAGGAPQHGRAAGARPWGPDRRPHARALTPARLPRSLTNPESPKQAHRSTSELAGTTASEGKPVHPGWGPRRPRDARPFPGCGAGRRFPPPSGGRGGCRCVRRWRPGGRCSTRVGRPDGGPRDARRRRRGRGAATGWVQSTRTLETAAREVVQERGLLGQRDGVAIGEHALRRAHGDPAGSAQDVGGEGDRGRADAVGDEVVLGDPDARQAGSFRNEGGLHGSAEGLPLRHAGLLAGQQEQPELQGGCQALSADRFRDARMPDDPAADPQQSRSSGDWFRSWARGETNTR
jgi:hypothetical protein